MADPTNLSGDILNCPELYKVQAGINQHRKKNSRQILYMTS